MTRENNCNSCGANNDPLFASCVFCGAGITTVDFNQISDQDLIMNLGEWIGKLDGIDKSTGLEISMRTSTGLNKLSGDRDTKYISYGEVTGNIEKYINLLKIRSRHNENLALTVKLLEDKYNLYREKASKKSLMTFIGIGVVAILLFSFIAYMASGENKEKDAEHKRLQAVEVQIEEAIKEKNYDYALVIVERLTWNLKGESTKEQYDEKRTQLRNTINSIKENSH